MTDQRQNQMLDCVRRGQADITEFRKLAGVRDTLWQEVLEELAVAADAEETTKVCEFAFLAPQDVSQMLSKCEAAIDKARISMLYEMCRAECGLGPVFKAAVSDSSTQASRSGGAVSSSEAGANEPPRKKVKMSMYCDFVDESSYELISESEYRQCVMVFEAVYGAMDQLSLPTIEQARWVLSDEGIPERQMKADMVSFAEWKEAFKLFKFACAMIGVATLAELDRYESVVCGLAATYRDYWSVVLDADDNLRSSLLAGYLPASDQPTWGHAFVAAADDIRYWTVHVDRVVTKLRIEDKGAGKPNPPKQYGGGPAVGKDKSKEICYAYQWGAHSGSSCPDGRRHVCLKCRSDHDLPRGNRDCKREKGQPRKERKEGKREVQGGKPVNDS
ncbi:hypothetical protein FOL47_001170 [Perkinsus chesapeaki]|uniref:Uncharacterized protein n=1 Tax=Perkinsus chesapeaki TaxID=330153 RepID=A0A7J6KV29_PERCH|nr:hypothetical protein FOL47_001170 [Perkinsus chesapeaki]